MTGVRFVRAPAPLRHKCDSVVSVSIQYSTPCSSLTLYRQVRSHNRTNLTGVGFTELTGIKCLVCEQGGNCRKDIKERQCPKEPLLMDKCMLMMDNENEQVLTMLFCINVNCQCMITTVMDLTRS